MLEARTVLTLEGWDYPCASWLLLYSVSDVSDGYTMCSLCEHLLNYLALIYALSQMHTSI